MSRRVPDKRCSVLSRISAAFRRFRADRRGAAAVEFCMYFPLMLTLLMGSIEAPALLWARGSVVDAASVSADLTSQSTAMNEAAATAIFEASERVVDPENGSVDDLDVTVSSFIACECEGDPSQFCFFVIWSHRWDGGVLRAGRGMDSEIRDVIPQDLGFREGDTFIVAEATYVYRPRLAFVFELDGGLEMAETAFFRPRRSREVVHVGGQSRGEAASCEE